MGVGVPTIKPPGRFFRIHVKILVRLKMDPRTPIYIYALLDPGTREPRYVGGTRDIIRRNAEPASKWLFSKGNDAKNDWVRSLALHGKKPELVQLEVAMEINWLLRRKEWIGKFKKQGFRLLNADRRERCRQASLKLWRTAEFREKAKHGRDVYYNRLVDNVIDSFISLPEYQGVN